MVLRYPSGGKKRRARCGCERKPCSLSGDCCCIVGVATAAIVTGEPVGPILTTIIWNIKDVTFIGLHETKIRIARVTS